MNFLKHYNRQPIQGMKPIGNSMTIEDQTLSLQQMLDQATNGIPLSFNRSAWAEEDDDEVLKINDLTDYENMQMEVVETQQLIRKQVAEKLEQTKTEDPE